MSAPRSTNPIGEPGLAVAARVRRLRRKHEVTTTRLSELLRAAGRPIHPSAITKIEQGERRIDVDDLVAIAAALGTTAARLLESESCSACLGAPPAGFACLSCGTEAAS